MKHKLEELIILLRKIKQYLSESDSKTENLPVDNWKLTTLISLIL